MTPLDASPLQRCEGDGINLNNQSSPDLKGATLNRILSQEAQKQTPEINSENVDEEARSFDQDKLTNPKEIELKEKAEQDSYMSNQSQKSSSTFSLPEGDLTSQDRYRCNSIKSTQSFEVPRPFSHTRLHDLNSRFMLKKTNSQTALQRQHKDAKSFLELDRVQRESSNELALHDSDTGGAVGSSIHFTMEDNSLSNA